MKKLKNFLSGLSREELSGLLGPTLEEVMAQEFDAATIEEIRKNAAVKAERMRKFAEVEAAKLASSKDDQQD